MSTLSLDLRGVESARALSMEVPAKGASVSVLIHAVGISALALIPLLQSTNAPPLARASAIPLAQPLTVTLPPAPAPVPARPRVDTARRRASALVPVLSTPRDIDASLPPDTGIDLDEVADSGGPPAVESGPGGRFDGTCPLGSLCGTAVGPTTEPGGAVVRIGGVIREPRLLEGRPPHYPPMAQAAGVTGKVVLEAEVGPDGRVRAVRITEGHSLFDEAALTSVRSRRYEPLLLNEVPTSFLITITVMFNVRR